MPSVNAFEYERCQRKGGCVTTTLAPSRSAAICERISFAHGSYAPHSLTDEQTRRVHREHRHVVIVDEPAQRVEVLAHRVCRHHELDAVVPESSRNFERDGGGFGPHR